MRKNREYVNVAITFLFTVALVAYAYFNREEIGGLFSVSIPIIIILAMIKTIRMFVGGGFTYFTVKELGKDISIRYTNYLSLNSALGNFFGPILGGASIRAIYLKKKYNLEYSRFTATIYASYIITFLINGLIASLVLIFMRASISDEPGFAALLLFMVVITIICSVLIVFPTNITKKYFSKLTFIPKRILNMIILALDGWELLRLNKAMIAKLSIVSVILMILATIETYLLFGLFVEHSSVYAIFLYTIIGTFTMLISITPSAIGIKEGAYILFSSLLMLSNDQVLTIAALDRSVTFVTLSLLYAILKYYQYRRRSEG